MLLVITMTILIVKMTFAAQDRYSLESLCRRSGGTMDLGLVPFLLHYSGTRGLGPCHLHLVAPRGNLGVSMYIKKLDLDQQTDCNGDFVQFGKSFLFFAQIKSPKYCQNQPLPDNTTSYVSLAPSSREWVEKEAEDIHLWLSVSQGERVKHASILVVPFLRFCGSTDRHWIHCAGSSACIRREKYCTSPVKCKGRDDRCLGRVITSTTDPIMSSGLPLSLLLMFALILVVCFLFCGLFLRWGLHYLLRKRDDGNYDERRRRNYADDASVCPGEESRTQDVFAASAPPPDCSYALLPPPSYSETIGSAPSLGVSRSTSRDPSPPPPYSLLLGPPTLALSYQATS